jgi:hypothetical protein
MKLTRRVLDMANNFINQMPKASVCAAQRAEEIVL